jgi:CheY-like chemotaxis protein
MALKLQHKKYFRLTAEGRSLWSRRETIRLPLDYRRILGTVDFDGHREVIGANLARFPAQRVDEWLAEFEALNLIEPADLPAEKTLDELAEEKSAPPIEEEDREALPPEATYADISLTRAGVYVNEWRVANRHAIGKSPAETVVLVVEDDPDQLALAMLRLTMARYPVKTADGVQSLFKSLDEALPDAILLDVMLPDGNGFDALSAIRRHPRYAHLPVVMVTAETAPESVSLGLELGCEGYITKPYGVNTLEYVLRYVLKQEVMSGGATSNTAYAARTPDSRASFSPRS